jgi:hypothetical protein
LHNWQDTFNGILEFSTAFFIWFSIRALWKERGYSGESVVTMVFWTLLSMWRIYFYVHLAQHESLLGEIPRMLSNCVYLGLMLYFGRKKYA